MNKECKKTCVCGLIAKILVIVGGLNWGLVGVGMLFGYADSWNLVKILFGSMPLVEAIVYILVALSAILMIFGCNCKKNKDCCKAENSTVEQTATPNMEQSM